MLHNAMRRFDLDHSTIEEDVRGQCPTNYVVQGAKETSLLIQKTKDLNACQNRAKLHSMVQSVPYNFRPVSSIKRRSSQILEAPCKFIF